MIRSIIFLLWILLSTLSLVSCGPSIKLLAGVPNLNVYTQKEIDLNKKKLPASNNIIDVEPIKSLNETDIKSFAYLSFIFAPYVFDNNNNLLCNSSDSLCVSTQLEVSKNKKISESFVVCDTTKTTSNITDFFGSYENVISKLQLEKEYNPNKYDYKVLYFINSDVAKNDLVAEWNYMYNTLFNESDNIVFIRIWTDLNEEWGLKNSSKVRTTVSKVKGQKREFEIIIKKLPFKK